MGSNFVWAIFHGPHGCPAGARRNPPPPRSCARRVRVSRAGGKLHPHPHMVGARPDGAPHSGPGLPSLVFLFYLAPSIVSLLIQLITVEVSKEPL